MKKVGIVTWYWGNYGSILQAYALQQTVEKLGCDCEVIRHHVTEGLGTQIRYRLKHNGLVSVTRYYASQGVNRIAGKRDKARNNRMATLARFVDSHLKLSDREFNNGNYKQSDGYDAYICGSDQVWNPEHTFLSPFYWLDFAKPGCRRIAYAPSIGSPKLFEEDKKQIYDYLKRFTALSVREARGAELLNDILGEDQVITVTDPTMLVKAETWRSLLLEKKEETPYLFAYVLRDTKEQRDFITQTAKSLGLKLMVYPSLERSSDTQSWGDVCCFEDDPFDFLSRIRDASVVITDSFHCSVFSLLFHKCFYVMKKAGHESSQFLRLEHLLSKCGVSDRVVDTQSTITKAMYDCEKVDDAIATERAKGLKYLREALEN